jgi:Bacterial Ig domain
VVRAHATIKVDMSTRNILSALLFVLGHSLAHAGTLTGSFTSLATSPPNGTPTNVNLSALGNLDWVHWGLYTDSSVDRKAGVLPQISDFTVIGSSNDYLAAYQYTDNANGYSWSDGTPTMTVTNSHTGVWAYGTPIVLGSGFRITAPADSTVRTLKVFVGAFNGGGLFTATLSDGSAPGYTNASLSNIGNGPSAVYTLNYSANSSGQTLVVEYILAAQRGLDPNVTLQAATLSAAGVNNPPFITINTPTNNAKFSAGSNISINTTATDLNGSVSLVEFYDGNVKIGQASSSPFNLTWNNAPAGNHLITAVATDNDGATSSSAAVEIFVNTTGGFLSASASTAPPSSVNLSTEGSSDWVHWGLTNGSSVDRKANVTPKIANFSKIGTNLVQNYGDNRTAFSWSDGTPNASVSASTTGIFIPGVTNGFEFTAPADTTPRTLKVYAGLYGAQANFQAFLSDFSAPAFTDTSLANTFNNTYVVYTLTYTAASAGQTLKIRYRNLKLLDMDYGNVTLQAATLSGGSSDPSPVTIVAPRHSGNDFSFDFSTQAGRTYTVFWSSSLSPASWQTWTNINGTGGIIGLTNYNVPDPERFYRVRTN